MLNAAQFSAAKGAAEAKVMQGMVFDDKGQIKGYDRYSKDVKEFTQVNQETWLRTEYESAKRQAIAISKWTRMQDDRDLYPYWVYRTRHDNRVRPEHAELDGRVFQIGDPDSDSCFPPNDWNCRCVGEPIDGRYLNEHNVAPATPAQAKNLLETQVDEQFRSNPAATGALPNTGSYFEVMPNANAAGAKTFGMKDPPKGGPNLTGLKAKGMHYMLVIIQDWRQQYHIDNRANLVFQNQATFANVRVSDATLHEIAKHQNGFENLPRCIENPDELWAKWENVGKQRDVLRAYILFGPTCYVVTTLKGVVLDGFACSPEEINKYRTGVIIQ